MRILQTPNGLTFETTKDATARRAEVWRIEAVTMDGDTYTDPTGTVRPLTTGTGFVAWFPTLKAAKAWAATVQPAEVY